VVWTVRCDFVWLHVAPLLLSISLHGFHSFFVLRQLLCITHEPALYLGLLQACVMI
jgi:hypothetical protein